MTRSPEEVRWTYADYLQLSDEEPRCEIVAGERILTPAPRSRHQSVSMRLGAALHRFVEAGRLGFVFAAPFDVVLSDHDVVQPDLLFISVERRERLQDRGVFGAPDLAIEILSPSTRSLDLGRKRELYARNGVREYWIVDPDERAVEIHLSRDGTFTPVAVLRKDADVLASREALPGFGIPLAALFDGPSGPSATSV